MDREITKFNDLELNPDLQHAIDVMGFDEPTPIQKKAIPAIMEGKDVIGVAQTGTGKTAAFVLPIINQLMEHKSGNHIDTLILAPTRELAMQIDQQIEGFAYFTGISSMSVYGGGDGPGFAQQKTALKAGTEIIIATPGRLMSHMNLGYVDFSHVKHFILDEADRMLDMGFYPDIMNISGKLPKKRQTLMFSATMPKNIRKLASKILNNPIEINIAISQPAEKIRQRVFFLFDDQKLPMLERILAKKERYPSVIIFASTKKSVSEIKRALDKMNINSVAIHSDREQKEREAALLKFKAKQVQAVVATDILARGIDIKEISLVVNFSVPSDPEDYIHRIGRTARAEAEGEAITFVGKKEQRDFQKIEAFVKADIEHGKVPGDLGKTPHYNPQSSRSKGKYRRKKGNRGKHNSNRGRRNKNKRN